MLSLEGKAAEGMSSQRGRARGLGSMLLVAMLLILLLSACHGRRKTLETINLSQRYGVQMQYYDTLWQTLSLSLDGLTVEWQADSMRGVFVRAQADYAELGTQRRKHTEVHTEVRHRDTLASCQESVEPASPSGATSRVGYAWLLLLLLLAAVLAYVGFRQWRPRWWS